MRRHAALLCLLLVAASGSLLAQTRIHRCIGSHGDPVFTDTPCAVLHATPVGIPSRSADNPQVSTAPALTCAANRVQLRQAVIDAFADHNANRLAGLMLWSGYGRGAAVADIRSLQTLLREPLLDLGPSDDVAAADGSDAIPAIAGSNADPSSALAPPTASGELVVHTAGGDGEGHPTERRFTVVRRSGCLWLRYGG